MESKTLPWGSGTREYLPKVYTCADCGDVWETYSTGRKPSVCKDCAKDRKRLVEAERYARNSDRVRETYLYRMYGLTPVQYAEKLLAQGGVCAICTKPEESGKALAVDHDHTCCPGKRSCGTCVRALLCWKCNVGLGGFQDDADSLRAALNYLEGYRGRI